MIKIVLIYKHFVTLLVVLLVYNLSYAQETPKSIKIEADKTISIPEDNNTNSPNINLEIPATNKKLLDISIDKSKEINMTPDYNFGNRGKELQKKFNQTPGEDETRAFAGNQYLGDMISNSKFVKIICRDHEYVDGDRVKVYVNDKVVQSNIVLQGKFIGFTIDLENGFNKIDFEALNEGLSSPNTAEFHVFDDQGNLISSNKWLLKSGFKASIVVVKQ